MGDMSSKKNMRSWKMEDKFIRQQTWLQTVVSQHTIHATLSGLEINALILFTTFYRNTLTDFQRALFVLALLLICISVWCIVWMVEHERREAYDSGQVTDEERNKENRIRKILNYSSRLSIILVALLLVISILK